MARAVRVPEGLGDHERAPGWLYKHEGKPWYCGCNWGGFYALDIDNPEFVAYLEKVFDRVFNEWGFDLVKLDFLLPPHPTAMRMRRAPGA